MTYTDLMCSYMIEIFYISNENNCSYNHYMILISKTNKKQIDNISIHHMPFNPRFKKSDFSWTNFDQCVWLREGISFWCEHLQPWIDFESHLIWIIKSLFCVWYSHCENSQLPTVSVKCFFLSLCPHWTWPS